MPPDNKSDIARQHDTNVLNKISSRVVGKYYRFGKGYLPLGDRFFDYLRLICSPYIPL